jgi:hypothetical protein
MCHYNMVLTKKKHNRNILNYEKLSVWNIQIASAPHFTK